MNRMIVRHPFRIIAAAVCLALAGTGCTGSNLKLGPVRYQCVDIPGYGHEEQIRLLASQTADLRYNAVCSLISGAREYARLLSDDEVNTEKRAAARQTVDLIVSALDDPDERIQSAALIFMAEFADACPEKERYFDRILNLSPRSAHVRFEQLNTLMHMTGPGLAPVDFSKLGPFLQDRSWRVRSMACVLLSEIRCPALHPELIRMYRQSTAEVDRILILQAFEQGFGVDVFALLQSEMLCGSTPVIRSRWAALIFSCDPELSPWQWLADHAAALGKDLAASVVESMIDRLPESRVQVFVTELLRLPETEIFQHVDHRELFSRLSELLDREPVSDTAGLLETAVSVHPVLGRDWKKFKAAYDEDARLEREREQMFRRKILPKYNGLLEQFLLDSEVLFSSEGMDTDEVKEATRSIRDLLELLSEPED